jgi:hypothetical protein
MDIESDHLRESKIGHVVYFLHMTEKESDKMRKKWGDLISKFLESQTFVNADICRHVGASCDKQKCELSRHGSRTNPCEVNVNRIAPITKYDANLATDNQD